MKKRILSVIAILALSAGMLFAQTEQGKVIIAGSSSLDFGSLKSQMKYDGKDYGDEIKSSEFSLTPSIGYFFADNLAITFNMEISSSTQKSGDVEAKDNSVLVGPGLRFFMGSTNIKPYLAGDIMFGSQKQTVKLDGDTEDDKYGVFGFDIGAGLAFFINDYISVDLGLGYADMTMTWDEDDKAKIKSNGIVFSGGFTVVF